MNMVTEDYVSFETAKLLKEKGFKGQGEHFYEDNKITNYINYWFRITPEQRYEAIEAPTLQMAMKWIREQGFYINVDIDVDYDEDERGTKWYHKPSWDWAVFRIDERKQMSDDGALYATYEQAAEVAIKWCLENLF